MSIAGKYFFPAEIQDTLGKAVNYSTKECFGSNPAMCDVYVQLARVKAQINKLAADDRATPVLITDADPLWHDIDAALNPVATVPEVAAGILGLPDVADNNKGSPRANYIFSNKDILIGAGLVGIVAAGYLLTRRRR